MGSVLDNLGSLARTFGPTRPLVAETFEHLAENSEADKGFTRADALLASHPADNPGRYTIDVRGPGAAAGFR